MRVHKNLAPANLQPLHDSLEIEFKKMKREVSEHVSLIINNHCERSQ